MAMNVFVIGLGSMGKRRIRLVQQIDPEIKIVGIDSKEERQNEARDKFNITVAESISEAIKEVDGKVSCAIVSTSPLSHASVINECLNAGINVFTELNLVNDRYEENIKLAEEKGLVLFLSSTFLYRDEIKYIQNEVRKSISSVNYCYHIGQYLPDWHPWEDYKSFFVGNKRTNGCREIMAIEFPWLIKTFGIIRKIEALGGKMSKLEVGYPDNYQLMIQHENGTKGMLAVDVVSRKPVRNLEIYGEDLYLAWDGSPTGLVKFSLDSKVSEKVNLYETIDHQNGYSAFVVENAYKNELIAFFDQIQNGTKSIYDFHDDIETLNIIDGVERQVLGEI